MITQHRTLQVSAQSAKLFLHISICIIYIT